MLSYYNILGREELVKPGLQGLRNGSRTYRARRQLRAPGSPEEVAVRADRSNLGSDASPQNGDAHKREMGTSPHGRALYGAYPPVSVAKF